MAHIPNPILHTLRQDSPDRVEAWLTFLPAGSVIWKHYLTVQDPPPPKGYTWAKGDYLKGACGHWRRRGWGGDHTESDCQTNSELATNGVIEVPLDYVDQEALF